MHKPLHWDEFHPMKHKSGGVLQLNKWSGKLSKSKGAFFRATEVASTERKGHISLGVYGYNIWFSWPVPLQAIHQWKVSVVLVSTGSIFFH